MPNLTVLTAPRTWTLGSCMNLGVEASHGAYVAKMDDDIARLYAGTDIKPSYVMELLRLHYAGPMTIRELADAVESLFPTLPSQMLRSHPAYTRLRDAYGDVAAPAQPQIIRVHLLSLLIFVGLLGTWLISVVPPPACEKELMASPVSTNTNL